MKKKTFWIGDDGDNKSVLITRKVYVRGQEIPSDDVDKKVLDGWLKRGLISEGDYHAPIVVKDANVEALEAKVKQLKTDLEKARSGKKADNLKALEADTKAKDGHIKELEENAVAQTARIKELEDRLEGQVKEVADLKADQEEKAALIEKQAGEIKQLTADLEAATKPGDKS